MKEMESVDDVALETKERVIWYQVIGGKVWELFTSLKLILSLLLTLAMVSIIGTVIEQGRPVDVYIGEYGNRLTHLILLLGLNDMYHTWWFMALLLMLTSNIIVCTIDRFPTKWNTTFNDRVNVDARFIRNLGNNHRIKLSQGMTEVSAGVMAILKGKGYRVKEANGSEGISLYAWKGTIGRFGSDITHLSLIIILTGTILGNVYGFRDFSTIYEGESRPIPKTDFQVKLDRFWIDYYETGQVKQYNSHLTVIEGGKEVLSKHIWVNEPLKYRGVWFYQSSYGMAWDRIREAQLALKKKDKVVDEPFVVKWGEMVHIPGTELDVRLVDFVADFGFDSQTKTVYSKSMEHNNQAIQLEVYEKGKTLSRPWLFLNYPGIIPAIPESEYDLVFLGYKGIPFTGLSVTKDPGTNVVWVGASLMAVGFILAFFVFHKRIWVKIRDMGNATEVCIGGMINKNRIIFEREFAELVGHIETIGVKR